MGSLYSHKMTDWLKGIPWYFYLAFIGVKLPVLTIAGFLTGLPLLFRRRLGDGRYFILFWFFVWVMTFMWAGGKFTRYFTVALPAVLITAAIGIQFAGRWLGEKLRTLFGADGIGVYARTALVTVVVLLSLVASINATPHFRLYTNMLGGGMEQAGYYFPHDEFYDASMRDAIAEIGRRAGPGTRVASESAILATYYADRINRRDLNCISLSDPEARSQLQPGDFIIDARGRRYFSNDALLSQLHRAVPPSFTFSLAGVRSGDVYQVDGKVLEILNGGLGSRR
jgi:hypothetical protein